MRRRAVLAAVVAGVALVLTLAVTGPPGREGEALSVGTEQAEADEAARVAARLARDEGTVDRILDYTGHVVAGRPGRRNVALTFDDGPGPDTARIMRILDRHDAKATFFDLGIQVAEHPRVARRQLRSGHAVAGHTNDHAMMGALPESGQVEQLMLQNAAFANAGLPEPRLWRPPYGSFDATTLTLLDQQRVLMVLWSVDTGDFSGPGAEEIARRVLDEVEPGSIVLMHDGPGPRPQTVEALPLILEGLEGRRLEPVTVPHLLRTNPPPRNQPPPTPLNGPG